MNKWEQEPNELFWDDEVTGLKCAILRHSHFGSLRGYVQVPKSHPLYKADYGAKVPPALVEAAQKVLGEPIGKRGVVSVFLQQIAQEGEGIRVDALFDVHGSITFSGWLEEDKDEFWYGFDCGHTGDACPKYPSGGVYRDLEYVKGECTSLAKQIAALGEQQ